MASYDWSDQVTRIDCPTLVVIPGAETIGSIANYDPFRSLPDAEFRVYDGLPHNICDAVPDRCALDVRDFLNGGSAPAGRRGMDDLDSISRPIAERGFAHVPASAMCRIFEAAGLRDWKSFAASWDDLGVDTFMADGGRYRRRRFGAFRAAPRGHRAQAAPAALSEPRLQPAERRHRALVRAGDRSDRRASRRCGAILGSCHALFDRLTPPAVRPPSWHVETHQFRIEARPGEEGRPTPEGMHRDGVDWVLVLLVSRVNVTSGETSIHDLAKRPLGCFTLTEPLDAAFTDDNRVYHGVTPVAPLDPARPGAPRRAGGDLPAGIGMDFTISDELLELKERTDRFVREEMIPRESDKRHTHHGPTEEFRLELVALARRAGLLAPCRPRMGRAGAGPPRQGRGVRGGRLFAIGPDRDELLRARRGQHAPVGAGRRGLARRRNGCARSPPAISAPAS